MQPHCDVGMGSRWELVAYNSVVGTCGYPGKLSRLERLQMFVTSDWLSSDYVNELF